MSLQVEKLEKNMAKLTIEVPAEEFEAAIKAAYNRNKGRFNIPGFRKGKAPLNMIEKMYGVGIFYEDAANAVIDASYPKAAKECEEEIVSSPEIHVTQIEKGQSFIYEATVAVKPEVTLGEYKGIEVEKAEDAVTEEDIESALKAEQKKNGRQVSVEDRPVQDGDNTVIDFKGYVDGKPFDGGESTDYPLTIGSHSFIDTFEEQLIGKNIGEACEVNVTFPTEYHVADLAGKPAKFDVTVKEIKKTELPELNDEFASEISDFDTLAEYKEDLKKKLQERKTEAAKTQTENRVVAKAVENAQMELPQPMIDTQARGMVEDYARRLQSQGLNINDYMKYTGMTPEKMMEQMRPEAEKRIKTRLVLEKIAETENVTVSEELLNENIAKMAEAYQMEADKLKELLGDAEKEQMKEDLKVQAAIDMLVAEAKLV